MNDRFQSPSGLNDIVRHGSAFLPLLAAGICSIAIAAPSALAQSPSAAGSPGGQRPAEPLPERGEGMPIFDRIVRETLEKFGVPGASLAVVKNGRLVVAKGYGWANVADKEPVTPRTLFSLASVSKPVSAIAVLRLVEQGRLSLDDRVYDVLGRPEPLPGMQIVPRAREITVRQILNHSAGWLRKNDPLAKSTKIAAELHQPLPIPSDLVVRWALCHPLDFQPGTQQSYSNFSYQLCRSVCESVTGEPFERWVRQQILLPLDITDMQLEPIRPAYALGEAHRYRTDDLHDFGGGRKPIGPPGGSWLASSVDMARFMAAVDGSRGRPLLDETMMHQMLAPAPPPLRPRKDGSHFGLGWDSVLRTPAGIRWGKNGGVSGISTYVEHDPIGVDWVLLMNGSTRKKGPKALGHAMKAMRVAIHQIEHWPDRDLFEQFLPAAR
ncbi:MAG TPA: serine hydrolase domain-containing protein [Pirellulales bacterium]|jgi:N-acyl-D-amino-acid deacylase|nr:serine hydrolase domain-containing protein [Pirellulales bacterium]